MATVNMFDLLGDDDTNDDPMQIAAQQQKIVVKKAAPTPTPAAGAKIPSKPLPPSQAVREAKSNTAAPAPRGGGSGRGGPGHGGGRGGRGGQGRDFGNGNGNGFAGSYGGGGGGGEGGDARRPLDRERGPYNGPGQPFRGGHHGGYGNEEAGGDSERPRRNYERRSGTGRGYEVKREGAGRGRGNWETTTDDAFTQATEDNMNVNEKFASPEKQPEQENEMSTQVGKENKEEQANAAEEKEKEDKEMTLEEYEKVREEKRKALLAMKTEERKVEIDNELKNMQQLTLKKGNDEVFIKLGSDKEKKKENADKDERVKKSLSITEFLKPPQIDQILRTKQALLVSVLEPSSKSRTGPQVAMSMVFLLPISFLIFLLVGPALARQRHVIALLTSADLRPSSLAWDPAGQHFIVGSRHRPRISSVSDAGVVQTLTPSDPENASSFVSAIAVDNSRRRLIAAFSSPAAISSYDLRSPVPHRLIFSYQLPNPSASVSGASVDPTSGTAFITMSSGQIFTLDLEGKISTLAQVSSQIGGVAYVNKGYLLVVDKEKGGILKVDAEDGVTKRVLISEAAVAVVETVAVRSDGTAVAAGGPAAKWVKSNDGWAEAAVYDQFKVENGGKIDGVAIRERSRAYVLVAASEEGGEGQNGNSKIVEVEWEREGEGEMVWAMVLVGLGLAYFMYWRFQMGKLVTSINKKRA